MKSMEIKALKLNSNLFLIFCVSISYHIGVFGQRLHSHNDYEQSRPFHAAYDLHFSSIEADLYIKNDTLFVAHDWDKIKSQNTFEKLYFLPLIQKIHENNGYPYSDKSELWLLIDLKKDGKKILAELWKMLKPYKKDLKHIKIIISGDMPKPEEFADYDKIFSFDGRRKQTYTSSQWKRIGLMSASFLDFGKYWAGKEPLNEETASKIKAFVEENHRKGKEVRLWGTPNTVLGFKTLKQLNADVIGADDLKLLADFMKK